MDLTHAYKVALEQTVKELFTDHQQQVLYDSVAEAATPNDNINEVVWETLRKYNVQDAGEIQPGQKFTITLKK